jgi:thiosulfate dehydrogenase
MRNVFLAGIVALCALSAGCAIGDSASAPASQVWNPQALPSGPVGAQIAYGRQIIVDTQKAMPANVVAKMSCAACHLNAGTQARGGSLIGTYASFPQWNKRAKRVIALQDRIAECFLYSMNGTPPAYNSKQMIAVVAYIAWLSRGTSTWSTPAPGKGFIVALPGSPPDLARGSKLYATQCSACHQSGGGGIAGTFPPLWGASSFNNGAGMAHLDRMTGFVMYNMPQNAPGSLPLADAYDIAGFVLSHPRPRFAGKRAIAFPAQPASTF